MKYTVLFKYSLSWNYNKRNIACFEQLFWSLRRSLAIISTVIPHVFLTNIKTIPMQISFISFSKYHEFIFLKSKLSGKSSVFPTYFVQKTPTWTHILRSPRFTTITVRYDFFHKYTWNNMNITNAKKK